FINDVPLLDVRAPVEFVSGAFPQAVNIPLLDDTQREKIGTRYKQAGQDEAIRLGLELATPEIKENRIEQWKTFCESHPDGVLYCFRGGLRSKTTQQWIRDSGIEYPMVSGGYKALRRYLIDALESSLNQVPLISVGGLTGVGKTRLLLKLRNHIDFEGLANHRGSAFGRDASDYQPSVIDWENAVSIHFLKHRHFSPNKALFVEDEGRRIGRIGMPDNLYAALLKAPRAILHLDMESRVRLIRNDYITNNWPRYQVNFPQSAEQDFSRFVIENLKRIQKRLGGEQFHKVRGIFEQALEKLFAKNETDGFDAGIQILLESYYDPMYRYQIEKKKPEILFEGDEQAFLEWAETYHAQ
ncbi:MAG: tRNA 2-selenouridine(34) synthase MnmH, partial [Pseudomonadota bacterium]